MVFANKQSQQPKAKALSRQSVAFNVVDVVDAVQSLYMDRLRPIGRVLRKRIFEQLAAKGLLEQGASVHIDMMQLRKICERCPAIIVQDEGKGEWSALLHDKQPDFVDIHDTTDVYPTTLWEELKVFFDSDAGDRLSLSGGRCSCAQELQRNGPSSLRERSLGEVCQIVEMALAQKKLLGYSNGNIVAYRSSQQKLKDEYAVLNRTIPCNVTSCSDPNSTNSLRIADLGMARSCLEQILEENGDKPVPLPNIKRLFLSRFHLQLSETVFGHSKVSDLLQDERFNDICNLEWGGNGFAVSKKPPRIINLFKSVVSSADDTPHADMPGSHSTPRSKFCVDDPLDLEVDQIDHNGEAHLELPRSTSFAESPMPQWVSPTSLSKEGYAMMIRGPFIHARLPPPTPWTGCRRTSRLATVPKDMGRDSIRGFDDDGVVSDSGAEDGHVNQSVDVMRDSSESGISTHILTNADDCSANSSSPDFRADENLIEDNAFSSLLSLAIEDSMTPVTHHEEKTKRKTRRVLFCVDDELAIESIDDAAKVADGPIWINSSLLDTGLKVQNTFYNIPPELPTPFVKSAANRSRSLPKTFGASGQKTPSKWRVTSPTYPTLLSPTCQWGHMGHAELDINETPTLIKFPQTPW